MGLPVVVQDTFREVVATSATTREGLDDLDKALLRLAGAPQVRLLLRAQGVDTVWGWAGTCGGGFGRAAKESVGHGKHLMKLCTPAVVCFTLNQTGSYLGARVEAVAEHSLAHHVIDVGKCTAWHKKEIGSHGSCHRSDAPLLSTHGSNELQ